MGHRFRRGCIVGEKCYIYRFDVEKVSPLTPPHSFYRNFHIVRRLVGEFPRNFHHVLFLKVRLEYFSHFQEHVLENGGLVAPLRCGV